MFMIWPPYLVPAWIASMGEKPSISTKVWMSLALVPCGVQAKP